jgi:hypothetical protein
VNRSALDGFVLAACFVVSGVIALVSAKRASPAVRVGNGVTLINCAIATALRRTVTIFTPPLDGTARDGFHKRLKPAGLRSGGVPRRLGVNAAAFGRHNAVCWSGGVVCSDGARFGVGELLIGSHMRGIAMLVLAVSSFAVIARTFQNDLGGPP